MTLDRYADLFDGEMDAVADRLDAVRDHARELSADFLRTSGELIKLPRSAQVPEGQEIPGLHEVETRGLEPLTPALQTFAVPTGLSRPAAPCASSRPAHVAWCHPIRTAVVPGADFLLIHGAPTLAPRCAAALVRSLT